MCAHQSNFYWLISLFKPAGVASPKLSRIRKVMWGEKHPVGRYEVKKAGDYEMCLDNSFSQLSSKTVYFEVSIDVTSAGYRWTMINELLESDQKKNDTISRLKRTVNKVKDDLENIKHHQDTFRAVEARDINNQEKNVTKVNAFSSLTTVFIMLFGSFHLFVLKSRLIGGRVFSRYKTGTEDKIRPRISVSPLSEDQTNSLIGMTWLRVLLMLSAITVSVQSFPSTTRGYEKETTPELETKETTDSIPLHTQNPQTMLDTQTNSEGGSSTIEFVFKGSNEGLSVQNGSNRHQYTISNLPAKNEAEKLNLLDSSKENEIDTFGKDELYKLNITGISKNGDLYETQIARDRWLFDPQERSSIMGGLPKYFYDAAKPIHPFAELSETVKSVSTASETESVNFRAPITEKSNQPPEISGPLLYPQSVFSEEIDLPFFFY
ncbi:hypothetical protein AVEN_179390-1 [Araneus ventricosus]|uniref:GOLD domain-containing protein n=1 Tax=Araneus ventricosus TaxID=182803 RepID=A0A4Y2BH46_ARAVE|nr:hypothetical protein AVEN_179390-1 [Araneus ventricosus]